MHFLNCLYSRYDTLLDKFNVYKVSRGSCCAHGRR